MQHICQDNAVQFVSINKKSQNLKSQSWNYLHSVSWRLTRYTCIYSIYLLIFKFPSRRVIIHFFTFMCFASWKLVRHWQQTANFEKPSAAIGAFILYLQRSWGYRLSPQSACDCMRDTLLHATFTSDDSWPTIQAHITLKHRLKNVCIWYITQALLPASTLFKDDSIHTMF